ncbi:MAG: hypothetical protein EOP49_39045 [Sphingobacteriales bacterium]|nr:MAG: hypothetical protein EOP49_39045 [Sphingobacteriales bacterium]
MKNRHLTAIIVSICLFMQVPALNAQNYDESKVPAYTLPDPLISMDGKPISSAADWENIRRKELLYLFSNHVYGKVPKTYDSINFSLESADYTAMSNKAHLKQVRIDTWRKGMKNSIHLIIYC